MKGKKQYIVEHTWDSMIHTVINIDFDHPNVMENIKEMVEFWVSWEDRLADNCGDYVATFLKQVAVHCVVPAMQGGTEYARMFFNEEEGWIPLDGSMGIEIVRSAGPDIDCDEFTIEERVR